MRSILSRLPSAAISCCPPLIIGGLLYAALYVKPHVAAHSIRPPAVARGDVFYGVAAPQPGKLWAAGSDGKIWLSPDLGNSWAIQPTPVSLTLQDIGAWDHMRAVAVGDDGVVLRTIDGGHHWERVTVPRSSVANKLMRVFVQAGGDAWAVGEMGAVLHSIDFGTTWNRAMPEEDAAWNGTYAIGRKVWIVGEFGRIAFSTDGGQNWTRGQGPSKSSLMAVAFRDDDNGMAVGLDGNMARTADGGRTWTELSKQTGEHLFDVTWDGRRWAAVGDKGVLVTGSGGDGTGWQSRRVAPGDRQWHTRILASGPQYIVAGGSLQKPAAN